MKNLLINGCFELDTLKYLTSLGYDHFAFDLRGTSPSLVTFDDLKKCLQFLSSSRVDLIFADEPLAMIESYLDLLKTFPHEFRVQFRSFKLNSSMKKITTPFVWKFENDSNWSEILMSPMITGIILPIGFRDCYSKLDGFWDIIDRRNLEVFIHADNLDDFSSIILNDDLLLSFDLYPSMEKSYRMVDTHKLKKFLILDGLK
jgi:hypothetical protein